MADGNITVAREASMEELRKSVAELLGEPADWPDHGNAPLAIAATMALLHEGCKRLEAENAALKREAHEWWTAARDATKAETERCALVAALLRQRRQSWRDCAPRTLFWQSKFARCGRRWRRCWTLGTGRLRRR